MEYGHEIDRYSSTRSASVRASRVGSHRPKTWCLTRAPAGHDVSRWVASSGTPSSQSRQSGSSSSPIRCRYALSMVEWPVLRRGMVLHCIVLHDIRSLHNKRAFLRPSSVQSYDSMTYTYKIYKKIQHVKLQKLLIKSKHVEINQECRKISLRWDLRVRVDTPAKLLDTAFSLNS